MVDFSESIDEKIPEPDNGSFFSKLFTVFRKNPREFWEMSNGPLNKDEIELYRRILTNRDSNLRHTESRAVLSSKEDQVLNLLPKIEQTVISLFGDSIGIHRIEEFFKRIDPKQILVIIDAEFPKVVYFFLDSFGEQNPEQSSHSDLGGVHDPISEIIFLKESDFGPESLTEELMHRLLEYFSKPKSPKINLIRLIMRAKKNLKSRKTLIAEYGLDPEEIYYSDPNEQIAKYMTSEICKRAFPDSETNGIVSENFFYQKSAEMGGKRIAENGWGNILNGQWQTNHEQDFLVRRPRIHRSTIGGNLRKSAMKYRDWVSRGK